MLEIKTTQIYDTKKVLIDDHEYSVRRFGAGEQLLMRQYQRKLTELSKIENPTDEDMETGDDINKSLVDLYIGTFDDGNDGIYSRQLINSLGWKGIINLFQMIWGENKTISEDGKKEG